MEDGAPDKALIVGGLVSGVRSGRPRPTWTAVASRGRATFELRPTSQISRRSKPEQPPSADRGWRGCRTESLGERGDHFEWRLCDYVRTPLGPLTRGYAGGTLICTENRVSGGSALSRLQK